MLSGLLALLASSLDNWCCIPSTEKVMLDIPGISKSFAESIIGILDKFSMTQNDYFICQPFLLCQKYAHHYNMHK